MKCLKWIALTTLSISCLSANAGNIPATTIQDNYIGAGYNGDVNGRNNHWDIDRMVVSRTGSIMTVDIITSYYNDIGRSDIVLGDLFMSTNVTGFDQPWKPNSSTDRYASGYSTTNWNYAYNINQNDRDNIVNYGYRDNVSGGGNGQLVSGFGNSDLVTSNSAYGHRANQGVYLGSGGNYTTHNEPSNADGWTNQGYLETDGSWYGTISFSFDVTGTALMDANQIAFRWAMSCANDIIEGLVSVRDPDNQVKVPEPQTLLLMLLGMAGIAYRRKNNT